jgi:hypothetical protein
MAEYVKQLVQPSVELVIVELATNDPFYNNPWPKNKMR